jgi:hypothetical protein
LGNGPNQSGADGKSLNEQWSELAFTSEDAVLPFSRIAERMLLFSFVQRNDVDGIRGVAHAGRGVVGQADANAGVWGEGPNNAMFNLKQASRDRRF